jgi:hypothetical protein
MRTKCRQSPSSKGLSGIAWLITVTITDETIQEIRGALESWFPMTWREEAKRFLGIDLKYMQDGSIGLEAAPQSLVVYAFSSLV